MEVYLIRHTTPDSEFSNGICYGQSDIPLAETFHAETKKLLAPFPQLFDAVYSSPTRRCIGLAQFIHTKEKIILDDRLLEMNFGDWEMKKWDEINQEALNEWMKDFVTIRVPNGENFIDLDTRVNEFMNDLIKNNNEKIAIVTHAGVIRSILCRVLEIPLKNAFKIQIDYGSITKIHLKEDNCFSKVEYMNRS